MSDSGIWEQIGEAVLERRLALGHRTREDFARASGLSSRILSDVEKARRDSYAAGTLASLERALDWPRGTVRNWLARGEVTPVVGPHDPFINLSEVSLAALLAEIQRRAEGDQGDHGLAARRRPDTDPLNGGDA